MSKKFSVRLLPAKRDGAFISTSFQICGGNKYPTKQFEAKKTDEVIRIVSDFAKEHGKGCQAYVTCLSKPKPSGFDKATTGLYFNLDG